MRLGHQSVAFPANPRTRQISQSFVMRPRRGPNDVGAGSRHGGLLSRQIPWKLHSSEAWDRQVKREPCDGATSGV